MDHIYHQLLRVLSIILGLILNDVFCVMHVGGV